MLAVVTTHPAGISRTTFSPLFSDNFATYAITVARTTFVTRWRKIKRKTTVNTLKDIECLFDYINDLLYSPRWDQLEWGPWVLSCSGCWYGLWRCTEWQKKNKIWAMGATVYHWYLSGCLSRSVIKIKWYSFIFCLFTLYHLLQHFFPFSTSSVVLLFQRIMFFTLKKSQ